MNLAEGRMMNSKEADAVLSQLPRRILHTLSGEGLNPEIVVEACGRLVTGLDEEKYLNIMESIGIDRRRGISYLEEARFTFSEDYLRSRIKRELGAAPLMQQRFHPPGSDGPVGEQILPLGVLLHIAAGNADGLPAFSVLEGLLTGNINILKLPEVDGGISAMLLLELIQEEPKLKDYIYVFDYSSRDVASVTRLIEVADAVVVWGGDSAVCSLRSMAPPNTKVIEWGHKMSFAYVTSEGMNREDLMGLARHICRTNQLLCTSAQGIYLDTDSPERLHRFCEEFLPLLESAADEEPAGWGMEATAQITLRLYSWELTPEEGLRRLFRGRGCSLMAVRDPNPEPSLQFRNCWVKPLPQEEILSVLRPHKNHLQTVGLLCGEKEREPLIDLLQKTGAVRVTKPENMSGSYCGAAHDGEYSLRRYTKIFSVEGV